MSQNKDNQFVIHLQVVFTSFFYDVGFYTFIITFIMNETPLVLDRTILLKCSRSVSMLNFNLVRQIERENEK